MADEPNPRPKPSDDGIVVCFSRTRHYSPPEHKKRNYLVLTSNDWNDFGARNMFDIEAIIARRRYRIGRVRIIIDESPSSVPVLNALAKDSQGRINFPIDERTYLSLPESIDVYGRLLALFTRRRVIDALNALHDATFVDATAMEGDLIATFEKTESYQKSLMRESAAKRAFTIGRRLLGLGEGSEVGNFTASLGLPGLSQPLELNFSVVPGALDNRISILIGRNGVGKTLALERIVGILTQRNRSKRKDQRADTLLPTPLFNQISAISLSPYENFPLDEYDETVGENTKDATYLYFGLRKSGRTVSLQSATRRAVSAIDKILTEHHDAIVELDSDRFSILIATLNSCLQFDSLSVRFTGVGKRREHVLVRNGRPGKPLRFKLRNAELAFIHDGQQLRLSAGQQQYVLQIVALCGYLAPHSLVLIDEPELGLHPNLEVDFIRALKTLLTRFSSYAIISTHSAVMTREVPASKVQILHRDGTLAWSRSPKIETFGADVSAIVSEVFGDLEIDPAFETQLRDLAKKFSNYESFAQHYAREISSEALSFVRNRVYGPEAEFDR